MQLTPASDSATGGNTQSLAMGQYRELAQSAYQAFQRGDNATASQVAGWLEMSWDNAPVMLRPSSLDSWRAIDKAMDSFIVPLFQYHEKTPDPSIVLTAYQTYVKLLDSADRPVAGDSSLESLKTASGVVCVKIKQGNGRRLKLGDIVILRSALLLGDGTELRHPATDGSPTWYWVLPDRHPAGFIDAMNLLRVGDSAVIVVPAALGYPKDGRKNDIPVDTVLTYVVDILDVKSVDVATAMGETIKVSGIEDAVNKYRSWQEKGFPDQHLDEKNMNALAYDLLANGNIKDAIRIFQLNVEAFPQSANVHDSLGEAYAKNGDKQKAIDEYQRALAIDPTFQSSQKALKGFLVK
jgi:tetratricopeptide (TPR) repeat protein